jgi:hypothetical protein
VFYETGDDDRSTLMQRFTRLWLAQWHNTRAISSIVVTACMSKVAATIKGALLVDDASPPRSIGDAWHEPLAGLVFAYQRVVENALMGRSSPSANRRPTSWRGAQGRRTRIMGELRRATLGKCHQKLPWRGIPMVPDAAAR